MKTEHRIKLENLINLKNLILPSRPHMLSYQRFSFAIGTFLLLFLVFLCPNTSSAQTPPVDLLDLSLSELGSLKIRKGSASNNDSSERSFCRWSIKYRYIRNRFNGYRDNERSLSNNDVLWVPTEAERTDNNFPVVPTTIIQEAHIADLTYRYSRRLSLIAQIPYIRQSTEHISTVPGFDEFTINSSGLGDITVGAGYTALERERDLLVFATRLSLHNGSIDEKGRTPRSASEDTQLPYTMQLGSGTYDLTPSLTYEHFSDRINWGASLAYTARIGRNNRGYSLGNKFTAQLWSGYKINSYIKPGIIIRAQSWEKIDGRDDEIIVPGPFPYPAAVTNPELFGGEKVNLIASLKLSSMLFKEKVQSLSFQFGRPVYEKLNGPQPKEDWNLRVEVTTEW